VPFPNPLASRVCLQCPGRLPRAGHPRQPTGPVRARGGRQQRHPAGASVRAGCGDAGLTSVGAGQSRTPPSRLPRWLPPRLHRGCAAPSTSPCDGRSRGARGSALPGALRRPGLPCSSSRDAPASRQLFPSPPLRSPQPPGSPHITMLRRFHAAASKPLWAPLGLKQPGNKSQPIAMPAAAPARPRCQQFGPQKGGRRGAGLGLHGFSLPPSILTPSSGLLRAREHREASSSAPQGSRDSRQGVNPSAERRRGKNLVSSRWASANNEVRGGRTEPSDLRVTFRAMKGSRVSSTAPLPQKQPEDEGAASRAEK